MSSTLFSKDRLFELYYTKGKSLREIASIADCSLPTVQRAMHFHGFDRRSTREAMYYKHHPHGPPLLFHPPRTMDERFAFAFGLGMYLAGGTASDRSCVRLSSRDIRPIERFMEFLIRFFGARREKFRFQIRIPADYPREEALESWSRALSIPQGQFSVTRTNGRSFNVGTLTLYYYDKNLREMLLDMS